ncbi:MerR family DNA-binding transcriptional regulator [Actinosynnema pretiosum subsp. pretiosum]|uniref:Transcriptional regulator, MerR family n=2 Tax=Actinosynnema TaxID=40566 RepID=C6W9Y5_ACTMD|nr:MerR family transcriptional regulator [Actinosynnema mirum]ACU39174.1 transcriptional regulator, MerR family [Actinosynnema mirum DSM 43827]AXX32773.1 transcriptional regulator, MerR family [Actinosynnema pretiosum subsp. pretiosum]QUF03351.1 MerR family DNA-binding transcriptional regulator [Actinosynnema pretiosum subsp. pretiosum]
MTSAGRPQRGGMGIGAVLSQLRSEFPGVTISKIRFLEAEGLVRPARTASGYRRFSVSDVERLRYVLTAQRDRYLPLKVIREQLDAADDGLSGPAPAGPVPLSAERDVDHGRGEQVLAGRPWSTTRRPGGARSGDEVPAARDAEHPLPAGPAGPAPDRTAPARVAAPTAPAPRSELPTAADLAPAPGDRLSREDLLAQSGLDRAALAELERSGLLAPGPGGLHDPDALAVARTVRALARYGVELRDLRPARAAADRELATVERVLAPLRPGRDPRTRARADEVGREVAALLVALHTLLVRSGVRELAGDRVSPR